MIQRIQSIYLVAALIATILFFYLPIWKSTQNTGLDVFSAGTHLFLLFISIILCLLHLISIFFYKKRIAQLNLCKVTVVTTLVYLATFLIVFIEENKLENLISGLKPGAILPFIVVLLNILAIRNIRRDEQLIRSMNRLR